MKRATLLFSLFLLTACIMVDDLGSYWNKGVVDPKLAGKWITLDNKSEEAVFANIGGMYRVEDPDKRHHKADLFKTLRAGHYAFLMTGPRSTYTLFGPNNGVLIRYMIDHDRLQACNLQAKPMQNFLEKNYPQNSNIMMHACRDADNKKGFCFDHLQIAKLDDNTLKLISQIPDDDTYWDCEDVMKRVH